MRTSILTIFLFIFSAGLFRSEAAPVLVTYLATGSAGNWTLDFLVTNNETGTDQAIYLFGVDLSRPDVTGSPAPYDPTLNSTWTNSGLGGSSTLYNNVWTDPTASDLSPGQMLAGFDVTITDSTVPTSISWFAISIGNIAYTGAGSFGLDPTNPGFEGVITPEPSAWLEVFAGLGVLAYVRARLPKAVFLRA